MSDITVHPVSSQAELDQATDWIKNHHYLMKWPSATAKRLCVFGGDKFLGVLLYGYGAHTQSTREIFQNEDGSPVMNNNQMIELTRAFTTEEAKKEFPNLGSQAVAAGNNWIQENVRTKENLPIKAILSYADSAVGHFGKVYQATNALYLGAPTGKHKFVYILGRDQAERDKLEAKIVKPLFSYPKAGQKSHEIPNPAKERLSQKPTVQQTPTDTSKSKHDIIKKLLDSTVKNPETGNSILVRTALNYDKTHPSYKQARGMVNAYAKKHNITLRADR